MKFHLPSAAHPAPVHAEDPPKTGADQHGGFVTTGHGAHEEIKSKVEAAGAPNPHLRHGPTVMGEKNG